MKDKELRKLIGSRAKQRRLEEGNNRNHQGAEKQTVFLSAAVAVPKNEIREHLRCPLPVAPSPSGCARRTPAGFRLHAEAHERSRHPG